MFGVRRSSKVCELEDELLTFFVIVFYWVLAAAGIVHFEEEEQEGGRNRRRSSSPSGCFRGGTFFTDGKKELVEHSVRWGSSVCSRRTTELVRDCCCKPSSSVSSSSSSQVGVCFFWSWLLFAFWMLFLLADVGFFWGCGNGPVIADNVFFYLLVSVFWSFCRRSDRHEQLMEHWIRRRSWNYKWSWWSSSSSSSSRNSGATTGGAMVRCEGRWSQFCSTRSTGLDLWTFRRARASGLLSHSVYWHLLPAKYSTGSLQLGFQRVLPATSHWCWFLWLCWKCCYHHHQPK